MDAQPTTVNDDEPATTDPLEPLRFFGVKVCWVPNLGDPAVFIASHRVMLLEASLSRAEVYAYVRRWCLAHLPC